MFQPLISVIIPVYNGEKYIKSCIENMLNQSYKNLEILIIDDGSVDNSAEYAKKYPVQLVQLKQNRGLSVARNTGMDKASGEYIHFMDVDDAINNDFYAELADAAVETGSDIACAGIINELKPHRTSIFKEQYIATSVNDKLAETNVGKWGYSVRYLFRKELLEHYNLRFEEGRFIEDLPFSLSAVYYSNKIVLVPNAIYTYIRRENSIMTNKDKKHRKKRHRDLRYVKEFRHNFARKNNFKIPGVPTGRFSLFFVKWFT